MAIRMHSLVVLVMVAVCHGLRVTPHSKVTPAALVSTTCDSEQKRIMQEHAVNNTVVFTALDLADDYDPLIKNYACGVKKAGLPLFIWSLTPETHAKMQALGYPDMYVPKKPEASMLQVKPGSDEYNLIVGAKPMTIKGVLDCGFDVLYLDSDLGINANPLPYFFAHKGDVQISTNFPQSYVNTGVTYIRNTPQTRGLVDKWVEQLLKHDCHHFKCGDQELLTRVLKEQCGFKAQSHDMFTEDSKQKVLSCSFLDAKLNLDLLPPGKFATGLTKKLSKDLFTYHPNFSMEDHVIDHKMDALKKVKASNGPVWCSN